MPINVTCAECQYHFVVPDEYAGRPGRCPECGAIINVPGRAPEPAYDPYQTKYNADQLSDSLQRSRSREDWGATQRADDEGPPERTFNAEERARRWQRISHGYRNILIAFVLLAFDVVIRGIFDVIVGFDRMNENDATPGEIAMLCGYLFIHSIALILWLMGRMASRAVPYVPARGFASVATAFASLTCVAGILSFAGIIAGVAIAGQNVQAAAGLVMLSVFGLLLAGFCAIIAELLGLMAQLRIATALRDSAFRTATQLVIGVTGFVVGGGTCFACIASMAMVAAAEKKQKAAPPKQAPVAPPDMKKAEEKEPANINDQPVPKAKGKANNPANPPAGQQPPPEIDPADHPGLMMAFLLVGVVGTLAICLAYINCMVKGRRAIRAEIIRLVGHDLDSPQAEHEYH